MAQVPVSMQVMIYPRDKSVKPYPATVVGNAWITGLSVGGGPVEPPPDIQPKPPLVIWGGPIDPYPDIGFPAPQPPPDKPPATAEPPHEGWNWSAAKNGWYYLHVPGPGEAQPKK
jgi:hypothetical protein